ncbi:MAG: DUF4352 domain-containing protein [Halalkalicoccus sp.]|nr:DUF4352 domain-containing protein [Halalkalicoccus sp.]
MKSMRRREFIYLAGAGTVAIAGCVGDRSVESPAEERPAEGEPKDDVTTSESERTVAVGEVVHGNGLSMVVRGINRVPTLDATRYADDKDTDDGGFLDSDKNENAPFQAEDGRLQSVAGTEFLTVELAIKNMTDEEFLSLEDILQPELQVDRTTHEAILLRAARTLQKGQLVPGEVERGEFVFVVPEGAEGLTLGVKSNSAELGTKPLTVDLDAESDPNVDLEQELRVPIHSFGERAEAGGIEVTLNDLELGNNLGAGLQPAEGNEYVALGATIENTTAETVNLSPQNQIRLKDGTGRSYPPDLTTASIFDQFGGDTVLADGESLDGKLAYQIEQETAPLYWTFDFSVSGAGNKEFWQLR